MKNTILADLTECGMISFLAQFFSAFSVFYTDESAFFYMYLSFHGFAPFFKGQGAV